MTQQERDITLIRQAKEGKQFAFTSLFNFYYKSVFYFVRSFVKDSIDAEDLTMVTFEKAFSEKQFSKYVPLFEFKTWLFKIAKSTAFDFLTYCKKGGMPHYYITLEDSSTLKSAIENPEEQLINKQNGEILLNAIQSLSEGYRNVIWLRYYDDLCYNDICSKLKIDGVAARVKLSRARKELNKVLIKKLAS